jgi:hypothetical protein
MRKSLSASVVVLLSVMVGAAGALAGSSGPAKKPTARAFENDPRSGAALNRDLAIAAGERQPAVLPGVRTINELAVNDPSADATAQDTQSETSVAVNGDNVVVGFNDSGSCLPSCDSAGHFTGFANSTDGGATFKDRGTLPASAIGDAGDPNLVINSDTGDVYFTTLGFNSGNQIPFFKSTNRGKAFGAPVNSIPGGLDLDKDWMAIDNFAGTGNGTLYVCATDFGFSPARVVVTHSTNGGMNWGPSGGVVLSNTGHRAATWPSDRITASTSPTSAATPRTRCSFAAPPTAASPSAPSTRSRR